MFWDPDPVAFYLPIIDHPVTWYGLLFATGFWIGLAIFRSIFKRFLLTQWTFQKNDVVWKELEKHGEFPPLKENNEEQSEEVLRPYYGKEGKGREKELAFAEKVLGKIGREKMGARYYLEENFPSCFRSLEFRVKDFCDSLLLYAILGTVIGARLGHVLFYENPVEFLSNPWNIIKTWEGGLASHGGIAGVMIAMTLFYRKMKKIEPRFTFMKLLDYMSIPTMLVCSMIRIGNFLNQEILGIETSLPWGVVFGHPADGSLPLRRHPVQLYEWAFYFSTFLALYWMWRKWEHVWRPGRLIGVAVSASFCFRFFIEYWKFDETYWFQSETNTLIMGQWLSLPMIALGLYFLIYSRKERSSISSTID